MNSQTLHKQILDVIKEKLPEDRKLIDFIMDTIHLGKDASYRRLRGEVPFTFEEIIIITQKLNISLDCLAGTTSNEKAIFEVSFLGEENLNQEYIKILNKYIEILSSPLAGDNTKIYSASNIIPAELIFKYKNLTKLRLFKWLYQRNLPLPTSLSETYIPDSIHTKHLHILDLIEERRVVYIFESDLFLKTIMDIQYFIKLNLFTTQDIHDLKSELLALVDQIEGLTQTGVNSKGKEILIYLSHVFFETSHLYIEQKDAIISAIKVYSVNTLFTQDISICNTERRWIQCMKKYSTLITQSGESDRINFIAEQKERISTI